MKYIKDPLKIEEKSFEIIKSNIKREFTLDEIPVVLRAIHSTGDYDYENIIRFKNKPVNVGIETIRGGTKVFTDTKMALSGINKKSLLITESSIHCYIDEEKIYEISRLKKITRSMAAIDKAVEDGTEVFVIGNAPTALFRLCEYIEKGIILPKLIIGVPVGFVGAEESKEILYKLDVPSITTKGTKGGSNVAAAIFNAILYMAVGR
ncbi:precorrin-8X methylmutase [Caloramator australicus]|uniref:Cobalt-precorrin-8x methylmutase n=1 Tax=Caloramator australicus RC3 TaxID=857293 RepID=I7LHC5_9CLOT|nr:precorrin-8X methylmutase [Caloramator australicus]CCJ33936.1 Cobalt-precorrin-8x methylmutase [Caloramator australicus RC3]